MNDRKDSKDSEFNNECQTEKIQKLQLLVYWSVMICKCSHSSCDPNLTA